MPHLSRVEFAGAVYHVTARAGDDGAIVASEHDRRRLLRLIAAALLRFDAVCFAYCVMGNHYHVVLQTWRPNLSRLVDSVHRRHRRLRTGRFDALLIERNGYLLDACRYVDLNPVDAGLVAQPQDWPWSSYRAHAGLVRSPPWLNSVALHRLAGSRAPWRDGPARYVAFVGSAMIGPSRTWE